jgi:phosphotransferase system  glucose/maltose/N-acetylglucosamine-specific IIC component
MSGFGIALLVVRLYGAICIVTGAGFLMFTIFVTLPVMQAVSGPVAGLIANIGTFGLEYAVLDLIGGIVLILLSYPIATFASKFSVDEASASRSGAALGYDVCSLG